MSKVRLLLIPLLQCNKVTNRLENTASSIHSALLLSHRTRTISCFYSSLVKLNCQNHSVSVACRVQWLAECFIARSKGIDGQHQFQYGVCTCHSGPDTQGCSGPAGLSVAVLKLLNSYWLLSDSVLLLLHSSELREYLALVCL